MQDKEEEGFYPDPFKYLWDSFVEERRNEIMNGFADGKYNFEEDLAELRVLKKLENFLEKRFFAPTEDLSKDL